MSLCHGIVRTMHLDFYVYSSPLRTRFRGLTTRDGLVVHGPAGWGEVSPFWDYDAGYSASWLRAGIEAATLGYPEPVRDEVPVNVIIPAVDARRAFEMARTGGSLTAKVKIAEPGQSLSDDLNRVAAVRDALGAEGKIRVDVNATWDLDTATDAIAQLDCAAGGLEYVEQPVAGVEDMARLRTRIAVPIAADESIRRATNPLLVRDLAAADVVIVKNQPLGGVRRSLELAAELGLPVVVSSALESSIGLRAGLAFAAALPELPYACGLGTLALFSNDVVADPLLMREGRIAVRDVVPRDIPAPDPQLYERWRRRLAQMWEIIDPDMTHTLHAGPYTPETGEDS